MPKRVFWPLALVVMGLILLATKLGLLPGAFWDLWPLILIVVGLGGLVTSDKEEWDTNSPGKKMAKRRKSTKKKITRKKK